MAADVFQQALSGLLTEIFDGPPPHAGFILNPGDPGLLRQLATLSAEQASSRPMPGQTTIAAHVDHVHYGFTLLNRWLDGEPNPWADADWTASWQRTTVDEAQWQQLRDKLKAATDKWRAALDKRTHWEPIEASGALASAAHTAYHLGAIRQIMAALGFAPHK